MWGSIVSGLGIRSQVPNAAEWRTGSRPLCWYYSLALHSGLIAIAFLGPVDDTREHATVPERTIVELEKSHKLIYYDFRKRLPEVSADRATSSIPTPSPNSRKSRQRVVVAPRTKDGKQFVYLPKPKVKLRRDLKAPNLIAIAPPTRVRIPPKRKPKTFQAPELVRHPPLPVVPLPNAPAIAGVTREAPGAISALINKPVAGPPPRPFVMPKSAPLTPSPAVAALPNAPRIAGVAGRKQTSEITALLNKPVSGPPPREFVMPKPNLAAPRAAVAELPSAPRIPGVADRKQFSEISALLNKPVSGPPPREFVMPKPNLVAPRPAVAELPSAPGIEGTTGARQSAEIASLLNKPLSGPPPRPFTPPPSPTSGNGGGGGNGATALPPAPALPEAGSVESAALAIIGLNPVNVPQMPVPEGSRPARIVAGTPVPGATRPELGGRSPIKAPDVSVEGSPDSSPATVIRIPLGGPRAEPRAGLARVQMPEVLPTTPHVSVPQWPSGRSLPAAVERHFQNRVVYMSVIPTLSGEDWVVWFGEATATSLDARPLVRPPTLVRSAGLPPVPSYRDHGTGNIRVVGMLHKDGRLDATRELAGPFLNRELAEALREWQFSPATRNGVAIDADAVIEIPVVFGTLTLR
ncbi:MAG: hypothetical protein KGM92_14820 [Acidobacteriota bacterium]|nr:hypothetical protein [Acidobacteriota bacterium]